MSVGLGFKWLSEKIDHKLMELADKLFIDDLDAEDIKRVQRYKNEKIMRKAEKLQKKINKMYDQNGDFVPEVQDKINNIADHYVDIMLKRAYKQAKKELCFANGDDIIDKIDNDSKYCELGWSWAIEETIIEKLADKGFGVSFNNCYSAFDPESEHSVSYYKKGQDKPNYSIYQIRRLSINWGKEYWGEE